MRAVGLSGYAGSNPVSRIRLSVLSHANVGHSFNLVPISEKMTYKTGPTNPLLISLVKELKKKAIEEKVGIWKRVAEDLEKPTRQRREVNLYTIDKYAKDGEIIVVPGKVLGTGDITKKVNVAAFSFSQSALDKILKVGGKTLTIQELVKQNSKGKDVRIMG